MLLTVGAVVAFLVLLRALVWRPMLIIGGLAVFGVAHHHGGVPAPSVVVRMGKPVTLLQRGQQERGREFGCSIHVLQAVRNGDEAKLAAAQQRCGSSRSAAPE